MTVKNNNEVVSISMYFDMKYSIDVINIRQLKNEDCAEKEILFE